MWFSADVQTFKFSSSRSKIHVYEWQDQSGNNHRAVSGEGGIVKFRNILPRMSGVVFQNSWMKLDVGGPEGALPRTIFCVCTPLDATGQRLEHIFHYGGEGHTPRTAYGLIIQNRKFGNHFWYGEYSRGNILPLPLDKGKHGMFQPFVVAVRYDGKHDVIFINGNKENLKLCKLNTTTRDSNPKVKEYVSSDCNDTKSNSVITKPAYFGCRSFVIGWPLEETWNGAISEFALFERALSDEEITSLTQWAYSKYPVIKEVEKLFNQ
eukprot:TRINITY_DN15452_c0_g1_i1.p1 TRINITY_DN15452_c0_g1~~TRINITY_DN15452_c0_g1_i1.p1  ORF type:complete len:265 (+),score=39.24 TRINITY_DN15452_c0_g1_i1:110-904(+)